VTAVVMELEVWGGDWGVPSVDHNCLIVMVSTEHGIMLMSGPTKRCWTPYRILAGT